MNRLVIMALVPVACLAACGENTGWNPNYSAMNNGSRYGEYLQQREAALQGRAAVPRDIPVQLPVNAPSVHLPVQTAGAVTGTARARVAGTAAPTRGQVPANAQVATTGPYIGSTPVLVRYAFEQDHSPGARKFQRTAQTPEGAARACQSYATADAAQTAFIAAGGPIIDPRGLDPDGDGFVCGWNPAPFRKPRI